ncbi:hypothetical protein, partial [Marichromatium gracile]|uniref:hypothetical protein n=1 Tax=Marichromatium gracile TaxID=1048 RepID=UPI001A9E5B9A
WRLEAGGWRLEAGGWRLEAGGWRLEAGGWRLVQTAKTPSTQSRSRAFDGQPESRVVEDNG